MTKGARVIVGTSRGRVLGWPPGEGIGGDDVALGPSEGLVAITAIRVGVIVGQAAAGFPVTSKFVRTQPTVRTIENSIRRNELVRLMLGW